MTKKHFELEVSFDGNQPTGQAKNFVRHWGLYHNDSEKADIAAREILKGDGVKKVEMYKVTKQFMGTFTKGVSSGN